MHSLDLQNSPRDDPAVPAARPGRLGVTGSCPPCVLWHPLPRDSSPLPQNCRAQSPNMYEDKYVTINITITYVKTTKCPLRDTHQNGTAPSRVIPLAGLGPLSGQFASVLHDAPEPPRHAGIGEVSRSFGSCTPRQRPAPFCLAGFPLLLFPDLVNAEPERHAQKKCIAVAPQGRTSILGMMNT
jgi:hypothetical protein